MWLFAVEPTYQAQYNPPLILGTMARFSRWNWLLAPVGFGISYRLALWLIHIADRKAWIGAHGGNPASVAFGEGEMDGMAILLTFDLLLVSAICCAFGPRVRPRET